MEISLYIGPADESKIKMMYEKFNEDRKYQVEIENYERAAALRDVMKIVSNYILGYTELTDEVVHILYYAAIEYGECVQEDEGSEVYCVEDQFFQFFLDKKKMWAAADEAALYEFLHRKHVTDKSSGQLFRLWWKLAGKKQYSDGI